MKTPMILPFERILSVKESNLIKRAIQNAIDTFERWGYDYIKLPVFDHFKAHEKALEDKAQETIALKDLSGGELIALRSDFTTQVVRSVSFFKTWHYPLRLYYFGTLFSSANGTHEKFQIGIELIGVKEIEGDAEVISAIHSFLNSLGLKDITLSVGHVNIVGSILSRVEEDKRADIKRAFKEKNLSLLKTAFGGDYITELILSQGDSSILSILDKLGLEKEREELELLGKLLKDNGINYSYDLSEVREFPYYTGVVFEFFVPTIGRPIAGGGRYDRLSEEYGGDFPATGGTIYVDYLLQLLNPQREGKDFFVIDMSPKKEFGFKLASLLRSSGYKVGRDIVSRALKHSLDYAFSQEYTKVVAIYDEKHLRIFTTPEEYEVMSLKEFLELL